MSKVIPEGWKKRELGEILKESRIPAIMPNPSERLTVRLHLEGVEKRGERITDRTDATIYFKRKAGQFIYGKQNLHKGALGIVPSQFDGYQSTQDVPAFDIDNNADVKWLYYYFARPHFYKKLEFLATGTGSKRIHPDALYTQAILLPPLPEQQKIAAILGSVDKAVEKTRAVIEQTRNLKRAMMQELLTRGIPGRHKKFKKTPVGEIPEEWEVVRLGDLAHVQTGIAKNTKNRPENMIKVPYLRVANVQDGYVDLLEIKHIEVDSENIERYLLRKGDVLFNEGGDNDKLGRGCVWEAQISPCLHQNHVFAVRCSSKLTPYYLATYAASPKGKEFFLSSAKQTTNLASINSTQLKAFAIPLPPIREQQDIMDMFKQIDNRLSTDAAVLDGFGRMKDALMQNLLTGQIRVKG